MFWTRNIFTQEMAFAWTWLKIDERLWNWKSHNLHNTWTNIYKPYETLCYRRLKSSAVQFMLACCAAEVYSDCCLSSVYKSEKFSDTKWGTVAQNAWSFLRSMPISMQEIRSLRSVSRSQRPTFGFWSQFAARRRLILILICEGHSCQYPPTYTTLGCWGHYLRHNGLVWNFNCNGTKWGREA